MANKPTPRTDRFMRDLKRMLEGKRGLHAQLASYLNPANPRAGSARLSEWIHRKTTPSAEAFLAIQEWVDGRR
jgi:hypothetical protein